MLKNSKSDKLLVGYNALNIDVVISFYTIRHICNILSHWPHETCNMKPSIPNRFILLFKWMFKRNLKKYPQGISEMSWRMECTFVCINLLTDGWLENIMPQAILLLQRHKQTQHWWFGALHSIIYSMIRSFWWILLTAKTWPGEGYVIETSVGWFSAALPAYLLELQMKIQYSVKKLITLLALRNLYNFL